MAEKTTLDLYLYGKLRRFTGQQVANAESLVQIVVQEGDSIASVLQRLGVPLEEVGSNVFLNRSYSALDRPVHAGDRLAVFPDDMQLLYKWYFEKRHE